MSSLLLVYVELRYGLLDICDCICMLAHESESVLLGSAILAATAAKLHSTLFDAMQAMSSIQTLIYPFYRAESQNTLHLNPDTSPTPTGSCISPLHRYYDAKYRVFLTMYDHHQLYKKLMAEALK